MGAGAMRCAPTAIAAIPMLSPSSQTTYSTTSKHSEKSARARNDFPGRHMPFFHPPYLIYCKIHARNGTTAPDFRECSQNVDKYAAEPAELALKTRFLCRGNSALFPTNMIPVLPLPVKNFYRCGFFHRSVFRGIKVYWDRASAKLSDRPVYLCVEQGADPMRWVA